MREPWSKSAKRGKADLLASATNSGLRAANQTFRTNRKPLPTHKKTGVQAPAFSLKCVRLQMFRHLDRGIQHPHAEAPFIVIPAQHTDHVSVEDLGLVQGKA